MVARRQFLLGCPALGAALRPLVMSAPAQTHVAVVGAGAFGGWTALHLLRRGARVTLLDAWGPGNARASSGGETRVIRGTYAQRRYTELVARSLVLWKESQARWRRPLLHPIGVLWLAGRDDRLERAAMPALRDAGLPFEELSRAELSRRFPQIHLPGVAWGLLERDAGYLRARQACEAVLEAFRSEGGTYQQLAAQPGAIQQGRMQALALSDGSQLAADCFAFAGGPWLGKLFPELLGSLIQPTRQEVFFFGAPAGDARFTEERLPVWIDHTGHPVYGIPGNQWRGFKLADDTHGPAFDPTDGDRTPSAEGIAAARRFLAMRFPVLAGAPLLEARVCPYENTPDQHLIVDRHPQAENAWIVGGGSGHGFKLGPAVGELASRMVVDGRPADPLFGLARLATRAAGPAVAAHFGPGL